jgi:hypothetical protein
MPSMANNLDYKKFNDFLNKIPFKDLDRKNKEELAKTAKDFEEFQTSLLKDQCSFCNKSINYFSPDEPCFHWLLNPPDLRAKKLKKLFAQKSYHQINPYLRWAANVESPLKNINDLSEERDPSKIIEETIKYKNLEWSFSCTQPCMRGDTHKDTNAKPIPHYHFQMKVDGNVIFPYRRHIAFTDYDHFCLAVNRGEFDRIKSIHIEGAGMQTLYENFSPEEVLENMVSADDEDLAQFRTQTLVRADEGTTISGEDLASLLEEHRRTKIPMAKLIRKLKNVRVETYISPGPGVPEIAARKPNRWKKKSISSDRDGSTKSPSWVQKILTMLRRWWH